MRQYPMIFLVLLAMVVLPILPVHAQEPEQSPLVVFIEDQRLHTASIMDPGSDGVTKLETIFKNLGARTAWIKLDEPLPEDVRVIVLVRPLATLPVDYLARLWIQIARGSHLLLAIDPVGQTTLRGEGNLKNNSDRAKSGLPTLLSLVYGISLQDTLVVEPWFSVNSIADNLTAYMQSYGENIVQHPVSNPLATYDLPVYMWGARTMTVEPIGLHSYAIPLLYTESAYGETDTGVFNDKAPLETNIGQDKLGRLITGALAENTMTGSRIVVLGDSELLENGFGLITEPGTDVSLHLGNYLFVERIARWLLNHPIEQWDALSAGYTWVALDGNVEDWDILPPIAQDVVGDALLLRDDIQNVRAFRDEKFLYVLIELAEQPDVDVQFTLGVETTSDGVIDLNFAFSDTQVSLVISEQDIIAIPDGAMVVGNVIEARLPLRTMGQGAMIGQICLVDHSATVAAAPLDCAIDFPAIVPVVDSRTPVDVRTSGPQAIVDTIQTTVNVRARPSTESPFIDVVPDGWAFAAIGRTALGDWVQVQNAEYTGWVNAPLLRLNVNIGDLPVMSGE